MSEYQTRSKDGAFAVPDTEEIPGQGGLTKREYFAAQALAGLASHAELADAVNEAVQMADGLIKELNRTDAIKPKE